MEENKTTKKSAETPEKLWYVVHVYSGQERKVGAAIAELKENCRQQPENPVYRQILAKLGEVLVPTEKQFEIKNGQRRMVEKLIFQGYVFIEMDLDKDIWFEIRRYMPTVLRLIKTGDEPQAISETEINRIKQRMSAESPRHKIDYRVGDIVKIIDGPFRDQEGSVSEVNDQKGKLTVFINVFGREASMELDTLQVRRP